MAERRVFQDSVACGQAAARITQRLDHPYKTTVPTPGQTAPEEWWVRSPQGAWVALRHQRIMPNDDGSITLLLLER